MKPALPVTSQRLGLEATSSRTEFNMPMALKLQTPNFETTCFESGSIGLGFHVDIQAALG
jgi:hypothetical protein